MMTKADLEKEMYEAKPGTVLKKRTRYGDRVVNILRKKHGL